MADQARPQWSCAYCGRCFATQKAIRNHIETERLRIGDLIEQLRIAFLHSTSPYSTHTTEDSHDETVGDSDGSVPDNQSSKHESIDQSNKGDRLRCPFPSCNGEETYTKKTNMFRHYQTHIECNEKCAFCKKPFNRLRKLVKHLEDCKVKKNQDRQGIWPSQTQYLALRRKDRLCKSALEQMEQQMDQKTRSKGVRKRRKDSTPTETASYVGDDDDSSAEEHPAIPTEQMLPTQTHLSVRKRRRTEGTTSSKDGQHTSYRRNFSELEMLLAAAESSARSPVNENGNLDGPSGAFRFSYTL
ncbi:MAG: hypothetical protein M1813_001789 [Trichoglossum hirsutum]|nr:MAG: hypothetical protein M1813_001789 [Trichoglossum hirsutum]